MAWTPLKRPFQLTVKRAIDLVVAVAALLILSPLMVCIAAAIKLTSKGPVLFSQRRLGKHAKVFLLYKFRTMIDGAVNVGLGLSTAESDPRITPIGRLLRRSSLDELPQLVNVLKGDMSLVGPRPTIPEHLEYYTPEQRRRLDMRPGLTGLSMIRGRANNPWSVRIRYDVEYVETFSLLLDVRIMLSTVRVVLSGENTYYDYTQHRKMPFDLTKP